MTTSSETRLRKALEPFADFAAGLHQSLPGNQAITMGSRMALRQLTVGDCREAKSALASSVPTPGEPDEPDDKLKYELFNDGKSRWVMTENYDDEAAPVYRSIQDAYNALVDNGQPFTLIVHGALS